jgi:hypothetical protein
MPLVLDAAYDIGYAIGVMIGVVILIALIAIPVIIVYVIYRQIRKKQPGAVPERPAFSYDLEPMMPMGSEPQGGPCPGCGNQAQATELYCANCGRQLQPIP